MYFYHLHTAYVYLFVTTPPTTFHIGHEVYPAYFILCLGICVVSRQHIKLLVAEVVLSQGRQTKVTESTPELTDGDGARAQGIVVLGKKKGKG